MAKPQQLPTSRANAKSLDDRSRTTTSSLRPSLKVHESGRFGLAPEARSGTSMTLNVSHRPEAWGLGWRDVAEPLRDAATHERVAVVGQHAVPVDVLLQRDRLRGVVGLDPVDAPLGGRGSARPRGARRRTQRSRRSCASQRRAPASRTGWPGPRVGEQAILVVLESRVRRVDARQEPSPVVTRAPKRSQENPQERLALLGGEPGELPATF
jgi:hypothetical protein